MDLTRLTNDADDLIRKVVSRYNQLYVPSGNISQVELDLILDDLRKLYDTFKTIGQINLAEKIDSTKPVVSVNRNIPAEATVQPEIAPAVVEKPITSPEPAVTPVHTEPEPADEPLLSAPELIAETPSVVIAEKEWIATTAQNYNPTPDSPLPAAPAIPETEKPGPEPSAKTIPVKNAEPAAGMLADIYTSGNKSLGETMAYAQTSEGMGSRMMFQPIADLISGIGLNDKFNFISELFGNNPAHYEEAVSRINKAVNADEAGWILQKYHTADWDQKSETLARLKDFIKRRFI